MLSWFEKKERKKPGPHSVPTPTRKDALLVHKAWAAGFKRKVNLEKHKFTVLVSWGRTRVFCHRTAVSQGMTNSVPSTVQTNVTCVSRCSFRFILICWLEFPIRIQKQEKPRQLGGRNLAALTQSNPIIRCFRGDPPLALADKVNFLRVSLLPGKHQHGSCFPLYSPLSY